MSKTSANNDYKRRSYDRIIFQFPQGSRDRLRAAAAAAGYTSVNAWAAAVLGAAAGEDFSLPGEFGPRKPGRPAGAAGAAGAADPGPEPEKK